jgi:hypothetical protein
VPQDYICAHMWFSLAAARGVQRAVTTLNMAEQKMTLAQITEAQKLARDWKPATQPPPRWRNALGLLSDLAFPAEQLTSLQIGIRSR